MARYDWTITHYDHTGDDTVLADVTSFSCSSGRLNVTDFYRSGTASINGRKPTDLPHIKIGDRIKITTDSPDAPYYTYTVFDGVVADMTVDYGIISSMDTWTITCEDVLAAAGRAVYTGSWSAGITTGQAAVNAGSTVGVTVAAVTASPSLSYVSAQSFTDENFLDVLNQLAATEQGRLVPISHNSVGWISRDDVGTGALGYWGDFSDGTSASSFDIAPFDSVIFRSLADNYASSVVVQPDGLANQTAGNGTRTFTLQTYDETTTQAGNLAAFMVGVLDVAQDAPSTISAYSEAQSNDVALLASTYQSAGSEVGLILRGSYERCVIEGARVTANPDGARFTVSLSSSDAYNFFILDDDFYGLLDQNKLGF